MGGPVPMDSSTCRSTWQRSDRPSSQGSCGPQSECPSEPKLSFSDGTGRHIDIGCLSVQPCGHAIKNVLWSRSISVSRSTSKIYLISLWVNIYRSWKFGRLHSSSYHCFKLWLPCSNASSFVVMLSSQAEGNVFRNYWHRIS
jgi:hypothetical protein